MKTITTNLIVLLMPALFLFVGCDDNSTGSNTPESGTISGTVTFTPVDAGTTFPVAITDTVRISIHNNWYPTGAPYSIKVITIDDLDDNNQYNYTFHNVAFDTYRAIAVDIANGIPGYHIWGVYGATAQTGFMDADSIIVSVDNHNHTDLNITASY